MRIGQKTVRWRRYCSQCEQVTRWSAKKDLQFGRIVTNWTCDNCGTILQD